jgi:AcrR family transcriptional regulator
MIPRRAAHPVPPATGVRERNKLERRQRIVQAAREVFREKGFAAATTREVAELAGVGAGTVFLYARDKRELLIMIVNDEFDALNERAYATIPRTAPIVTQLVHYFSPQLRFWSEDVGLARLTSNEMHAALSSPRTAMPESERLHNRRRKTFEQLTDIVAEARRRKLVTSACDPELAAHLIFDIHIGENRKWLSGEKPTYRDGVVRLRKVLTFALQGFIRQNTRTS